VTPWIEKSDAEVVAMVVASLAHANRLMRVLPRDHEIATLEGAWAEMAHPHGLVWLWGETGLTPEPCRAWRAWALWCVRRSAPALTPAGHGLLEAAELGAEYVEIGLRRAMRREYDALMDRLRALDREGYGQPNHSDERHVVAMRIQALGALSHCATEEAVCDGARAVRASAAAVTAVEAMADVEARREGRGLARHELERVRSPELLAHARELRARFPAPFDGPNEWAARWRERMAARSLGARCRDRTRPV